MPWAYDKERVNEIIAAGADEIETAVTTLVDRLIDHGAIRIHSGAASVFQERKQIIATATQAARSAVLTCDWSMLDDDTASLEQAKSAA